MTAYSYTWPYKTDTFFFFQTEPPPKATARTPSSASKPSTSGCTYVMRFPNPYKYITSRLFAHTSSYEHYED